MELITTDSICQLTFYILSIGILLGSLEYLFIALKKSAKGLPNWKISKEITFPFLDNPVINWLFKPKNFIILLLFKMVLVFVLFFTTIFSDGWTLFILLLFLVSLLIHYRDVYGKDGSDQMQLTIILILALCTSNLTTQNIKLYGLFFITAQSYLSYLTAGISKILSKSWRQGNALFLIVNTASFGNVRLAKLLHKGKLSFYLGWFVIITEILFPFTILLPFPYLIFCLSCMFLFHIINAFIMGLNIFPWAFLSTYPSIIFVNHYILNTP